MIYYEVRNERDLLVASSLESCPSEILELLADHAYENLQLRNFRNAYRKDSRGSVRLIIVDDKDLSKSSRGIAQVADIYLGLVPEFNKIRRSQRQHFDTILRRFTHNLVDVQKRLKGQLQRVVPDHLRERDYDAALKSVAARVESNTSLAAEDFLQITQRATDLDAQIAGLRVISGLSDEMRPSYIRANILHEVFRYEQPFDSDLKEKGIAFDVQISPEEAIRNRAQVDPALLNVAFSQFYNNALKYARPNTKIAVHASFDNKKCTLKISMTSAYIEADEVEKIFKEKYIGRHAGYAAGDGVGMFLVRRALQAMEASITVTPDTKAIYVGDRKYGENTFMLEFVRKD